MKTVTKTAKTTRRKPPQKATSIRIDADIYEQANQYAEADKRSFSQIVELALERYIRQEQTLAQYFQPGAAYPVFTPHGQEAMAAKLTELLKGGAE